jgi:hypothetical protein
MPVDGDLLPDGERHDPGPRQIDALGPRVGRDREGVAVNDPLDRAIERDDLRGCMSRRRGQTKKERGEKGEERLSHSFSSP